MDASWRWSRRFTAHLKRRADDLQFPRCGAILEEFPRFAGQPKGIDERSLADFKLDPFDPRLRTHKIHSLSALYKRTIYSVTVESDLRVVFFIESNTIFTVDIGTHDIYRV